MLQCRYEKNDARQMKLPVATPFVITLY